MRLVRFTRYNNISKLDKLLKKYNTIILKLSVDPNDIKFRKKYGPLLTMYKSK